MSADEAYISLSRAASMLGVSRPVVKRLIAAGELDQFEDRLTHRSRLVRESDIERLQADRFRKVEAA